MKKIVLLLLLNLLISSCQNSDHKELVSASKGNVFICNEGNFMSGNATLSLYNSQTGTVQNKAFFNANGFPIGDVLQSMTIIGQKGFLVVNNSGKIVVIDINNCQYQSTIKGLTSPRYVTMVAPEKLYVSDLYSPSMTIINPNTLEVTGHIYVGKSTEQMVQIGDFVYVIGWSFNDKIYKINVDTDKVVDSLTITKQPNSIVADKNGKLWVLSDGGYPGSPYGTEIAALTRVDAASFAVEQKFELSATNTDPSELCINATKDTLYFIAKDVFQMKITDNTLPETPFVPQEKKLFYALAVDPYTNQIYVSDSIDYTQQGVVYRYEPDGQMIDSFKVDIIPGSFCFAKL